ncbi:MAG: exodeoxyribonuclease VII large subunit [Thermomicrobiales bacterium]
MTDRILPVGVVLRRIRQVLEGDSVLSDAWVEGEVSKFQIWNSGHAYFTLKDESGVLEGMMWKTKVNRQSFIPRVGDQVIVNGTVTIYEARGQLQFDANVFQPAGTGLLQAQFEALRQKLEAEGLFDPSRKRPLPRFPKKIGVATSPSGAVWHDIQRVIERRYPLVELILAPTLVQGEQAPNAIVAAINRLLELPDLDVIIVGRGGGSIEDLWCFNDERVVRSLFSSSVPMISAVGHETDFTLSDFVADVRAATPSAAAELVVPDINQLIQEVEGYRLTAKSSVLAGLQERLADVQSLVQRLNHMSPIQQLVVQQARLDFLTSRAAQTIERSLTLQASRIDQLHATLTALDPQAMLRRGYAQITRANDGNLVSRASQAVPDDLLRAEFADGTLDLATLSVTIRDTSEQSPIMQRGQS